MSKGVKVVVDDVVAVVDVAPNVEVEEEDEAARPVDDVTSPAAGGRAANVEEGDLSAAVEVVVGKVMAEADSEEALMRAISNSSASHMPLPPASRQQPLEYLM